MHNDSSTADRVYFAYHLKPWQNEHHSEQINIFPLVNNNTCYNGLVSWTI